MLLKYFQIRSESKDTAGQVLLIEEPEAHLHPQLQRVIFGRLLSKDCQVITSSHSTHITSRAPLANLLILTREPVAKTSVTRPSAITGLEEEDIADLERYLDATKSVLLYAKRFINEGDILYISGGTTTLELAKILFDVGNVIVFTNAINVLLELANNSDISIKLIGGDFRRKTFSMVGQDAIGCLDRYNFDKAFIGVNGISVEEGLTTPNEFEAIVDGKVVRMSKETFVLADDSKFGAVTFSRICKIVDVNYIITNKQLNSNLARDIQKNKVKIVYK